MQHSFNSYLLYYHKDVLKYVVFYENKYLNKLLIKLIKQFMSAIINVENTLKKSGKISLKIPKKCGKYDIIIRYERRLEMDIKINGDYITLGQFLKLTNFISSGGEAKLALKELAITVNGETENRRGRKLRISDVIIIEGSKFHIV